MVVGCSDACLDISEACYKIPDELSGPFVEGTGEG